MVTWYQFNGFGPDYEVSNSEALAAEPGTDDFDRILGDELDLELDPLAYLNQ